MPPLEDSTGEETRRQRRAVNQPDMPIATWGYGLADAPEPFSDTDSDADSETRTDPDFLTMLIRRGRYRMNMTRFEATCALLHQYEHVGRMNAYRDLHLMSTINMGRSGLWAYVMNGTRASIRHSASIEETTGNM